MNFIKRKKCASKASCSRCGKTQRVRHMAFFHGKFLCYNCRIRTEDSTNKKKELRTIARELGRCTNCYNEKETPRYRTCARCRDMTRGYAKKCLAKKARRIKCLEKKE